MSYSRYRAKGEVPETVYVVTNGSTHRLYSTIGAARGVRTSENNSMNRGHSEAPRYKIFQAIISDWEEVDAEV